MKQHPSELVDAIRRHWKDGALSASEIGRELGITTNSVLGIIRRRRCREGSALWPARPHKNGRSHTARKARPARPEEAPRFVMPKRILPNPIPWLERGADQCAWIEDDPGDQPIDELQCCGAPVRDGTSWCAFHGRLVVSAPGTRKPMPGGFRLGPLGRRAA